MNKIIIRQIRLDFLSLLNFELSFNNAQYWIRFHRNKVNSCEKQLLEKNVCLKKNLGVKKCWVRKNDESLMKLSFVQVVTCYSSKNVEFQTNFDSPKDFGSQ